jgi:outer membrane protein assembly factor BamB
MGPLTRRQLLSAAGISLVGAAAARAADWPMYRGLEHDGHTADKIGTSWPSGGPHALWRAPMGLGFSSVSPVGDAAYCNGAKDGQECCWKLDAKTGKALWIQPIDQEIMDNQGGNGPRSTPTISDDHVFVLGTYLKLDCLNGADGKRVWRVDLQKEFNGKVPQWGSAASPVLDGGKIFLNCGAGNGKSLMAFDPATGKNIWAKEDDKLVHASPTPATIDGVRQIIFLTASGLVSMEPETGSVLWRYSFPHRTSTAASPIVGGNMVFCSAGYGIGCACVEVHKIGDTFEVKELYRKPGKLMLHWSTPVYSKGHLYGLFEDGSALRCVEMASGVIKWQQAKPQVWRGGTVFTNGCVLVQEPDGNLVLVKADPTAHKELARCQPLSGKCWTMPTISDGRIFARSDEQIVCLDVSMIA